MDKKWIVAGLVVMLLIVVGYGVGTTLHTPGHLLPGHVDETGAFKHVEKTDYWSVEATMPHRTGLWSWWNPGPDARVRGTIETWLTADIEEFKKGLGLETLSPEERQSVANRGGYSYGAQYERFSAANDRLTSYKYDIYMDTGGAHPNAFFKTFVFDKEGQEIRLTDLFIPGSGYLERIATTSLTQITSDLETRLEVDTEGAVFADGVAPRESNFANFVIDGLPAQAGDTLMLYFPPYQVAAYAAGPFEVRIPFSELGDVLRPEWR